MNPNPLPKMTPDEFLAFERASDEKHEYRDGEIVAMSGAKRAHNLIALNLAGNLHSALKGRDCEAYIADMRVWIPKASFYTYPDIVVVCGELIFRDPVPDTLENPTVLIEILSESTENYDRGQKFENYRKIESLREYILVSQTRPHTEKYVRHGDGFWVLSETTGLESTITVESIDFSIPLTEIYDKVKFEDE